jgi:glyoxylase-like metal-dependent hydrolase (beta-lactamase superfamily II)/8-oxo-dGTP pyrophosphatase MutT (NUDIX family)
MSDSPSHPTAPQAPSASATVILVRDAASGPELLLMRRAERGDQNSGMWVFPGGRVEAGDRAAHGWCAGLDDATASARLGLPDGGLDYLVASVRECFEESGLLLASDAAGRELALSPQQLDELSRWRGALHRGERTLAGLCQAFGCRLAVDRLAYVSHWVTPLGMPKRFDTRFFLAQAPQAHAVSHDDAEMVDFRWITPAAALAGREGVQVHGPARRLAEALQPLADVAAMLAWARGLIGVPRIQPRLARVKGAALGPVLPGHPAYAELGLIDPEGSGRASDTIEPGKPVPLGPGLIRVSANNGSVMTGPGTNSYLLRSGLDDNSWLVIDPGPADEAHHAALLAAAPGPIRWIAVTHTHIDHSPGAVALQAATGAAVLGRIAAHAEWQDASFAPTQLLQGGERLELGPELTLAVVHTPGHASNHLCYRWVQRRMLFTGDHVMQGSTVVINPPDGVMADYIASLRALTDVADGPAGFDWIAPGHGFLMPQPREVMTALVAHRLRREARVAEVLKRRGPAAAEALVPEVYDDVSSARHGVALRSLLAHLQHLQSQGLATEQAGRWTAAD